MTKFVPLLALAFFAPVLSVQSQPTSKKADRKVVTPGAMEIKPVGSKATSATALKATTAFVRVLHAIPNGPHIDAYVGSLQVASERGFTGLTSYVAVRSGKSALKVFREGKTSPVLTADSFTFARGNYYTIAIYGKKVPQLLSINESKGKENLEKARVRVIHLAPGSPEFIVTAPSTRGDLGYSKFVSKPLEYGKSGSKLLAPKETTIQIRDADDKLLKETPSLTFEAGKRYSAFIIGEIGGSGKNALDILVKPTGK